MQRETKCKIKTTRLCHFWGYVPRKMEISMILFSFRQRSNRMPFSVCKNPYVIGNWMIAFCYIFYGFVDFSCWISWWMIFAFTAQAVKIEKGDKFAFWMCTNAFCSVARVQKLSILSIENICWWTVQLAVAKALFICNKTLTLTLTDNLVWNSHRYFHRNDFVREYNFRLNLDWMGDRIIILKFYSLIQNSFGGNFWLMKYRAIFRYVWT